MPRYEVEFPDLNAALSLALLLREKRTGSLPCFIKEHPGTEVVLDMSVSKLAFSVSLLFRIVQANKSQTVIEWWPRRQTDPALLDLWVDALEAQDTPAPSGDSSPKQTPELATPAAAPISSIAARELFDLCRRALSKNPFTVLGLHWSSDTKDFQRAYTKLITELESYKKQPNLTPKAHQFINLALKQAPKAMQALSSAEGRVAARERFVPANQLSHARELIASKLQVAQLRHNSDDVYQLTRRLTELGG
jgi:hypothetical protein